MVIICCIYIRMNSAAWVCNSRLPVCTHPESVYFEGTLADSISISFQFQFYYFCFYFSPQLGCPIEVLSCPPQRGPRCHCLVSLFWLAFTAPHLHHCLLSRLDQNGSHRTSISVYRPGEPQCFPVWGFGSSEWAYKLPPPFGHYIHNRLWERQGEKLCLWTNRSCHISGHC